MTEKGMVVPFLMDLPMTISSVTDAEREALIQAARAIRAQAYAPYSNFAVGAAVLAADGQIYTGVNVENASYGLTICAERNAIALMASHGQRQIVAAAVATSNGVTPCGACRQVLREFTTAADYPIWLIAETPFQIRLTSLHQLLPDSFDASQLE